MKRRDLKKRIKSHRQAHGRDVDQIPDTSRPRLDYSRRKFDAGSEPSAAHVRGLFQSAVNRTFCYIQYNHQKDGKLQELIRSLKKKNQTSLKNEAKKTEEVIKQSNPVMTRKIENLVMKQINFLSNSTVKSFEHIQNIGAMLRKIQD